MDIVMSFHMKNKSGKSDKDFIERQWLLKTGFSFTVFSPAKLLIGAVDAGGLRAKLTLLAMLVLDCIVLSLLFIDSGAEKSSRYMHSRAHRGGFNIEPCTACEGKRLCHIPTDAKKRCQPKTGLASFAVLWHSVNGFTHIKRENAEKPTLR